MCTYVDGHKGHDDPCSAAACGVPILGVVLRSNVEAVAVRTWDAGRVDTLDMEPGHRRDIPVAVHIQVAVEDTDSKKDRNRVEEDIPAALRLGLSQVAASADTCADNMAVVLLDTRAAVDHAAAVVVDDVAMELQCAQVVAARQQQKQLEQERLQRLLLLLLPHRQEDRLLRERPLRPDLVLI